MPKTLLSPKGANILVNYLIECGEWGYGYTKQEVLFFREEMCSA